MTLSTNVISGINKDARTTINLSVLSTNTAVVGLYYSTTNLGFEFFPNPNDNGIIKYRYAPHQTSTTTILGFDGPTMFIKIDNFTANTISIINPATNVAGLNIFVNQATYGGGLAINSNTGSTRIQLEADANQQGAINFYKDDLGTSGTRINASTVASEYIAGSTLEAINNIVLHAENGPERSSILSMAYNGDLLWNGEPVGSGGGGGGGGDLSGNYSTTIYGTTSSLFTTNITLLGKDSFDTAILYADSNLDLYWNGEKLAVGQQNIFESTIYQRAVIINISTLRITTSTIQGVYDEPSLPSKLLLLGDADLVPTPIYYSLDNYSYNLPDVNGEFRNTGNSVYGDMYTGLLIAVGTDNTDSFSTIQWSNDAVNWNYITANNPFKTIANCVLYANGIWIIGGTVPDEDSPLIWSTDGLNFYTCTVPPVTGTTAYSIAYNNGLFVAANNSLDSATTLLWSEDGKFWRSAISGGINGGAVAVGSNNASYNIMWVASGITALPEAKSRIQYSYDGKNWTTSLNVPLTFTLGVTVNYANGVWHVAGTSTQDSRSILWSEDGINWYSQLSGNLTGVNKIRYINDIWYAVGNTNLNNGMLSSGDGKNWTPVLTSDLYENSIKDIYYLDNVLLGNGSINYAVSTSIYVPATVSSNLVNTSNLLCSNSITSQSATISSLTVTSIKSPNYLQVQTVIF